MAYSNIKVSLSADIQDVWEFITNLNQQLWRRDVASVEILDEKTFIEHTPEGYQTTFTITVGSQQTISGQSVINSLWFFKTTPYSTTKPLWKISPSL